MHDMKFCREENVDQHVWKCLYYNVIELVKRQLAAMTTTTTTEDTVAPSTERMAALRERCLAHIDDGIVRFEQSLRSLEETYKFQLDAYLDNNAGSSMKGLKFVALALVSAQKIFLILGDLSRYREQLNGTKNFGRAKQWYTKAQQIIPSNGMPYNQLAIISLYTVIFPGEFLAPVLPVYLYFQFPFFVEEKIRCRLLSHAQFDVVESNSFGQRKFESTVR